MSRLREARLAARLTQAALGEAAGYSRSAVAEAERGRPGQSKRLWEALAKELKTTPEQIRG